MLVVIASGYQMDTVNTCELSDIRKDRVLSFVLSAIFPPTACLYPLTVKGECKEYRRKEIIKWGALGALTGIGVATLLIGRGEAIGLGLMSIAFNDLRLNCSSGGCGGGSPSGISCTGGGTSGGCSGGNGGCSGGSSSSDCSGGSSSSDCSGGSSSSDCSGSSSSYDCSGGSTTYSPSCLVPTSYPRPEVRGVCYYVRCR